MKSLILNLGSHSVTGGIETYVRDLHQGLADHDVHTLSLWDREEDVPPSLQKHVTACGRSKLRFLQALKSRLRNEKPDVVWVGHVLLLAATPVIKALRPGAKIVVLTYGLEVWRPLPLAARALLRRADAVVTISEHTRARMAKVQGLESARVALVPPAVGSRMVGAALGTPDRTREGDRILTVARLGFDVEEKGIQRALRAMLTVIESNPGVRYSIVGDGERREELEREAAALGLDDCVDFLGRVSESDLWRAYADADVFLLPSSGEGFGIVFAEAMLWELPIVAGNADATPEVVPDGEAGLLVAPHDIRGMASALSGLLGAKALRDEMGRAGRDRVLASYTFENFAQRVRRVRESLRGAPAPHERAAEA